LTWICLAKCGVMRLMFRGSNLICRYCFFQIFPRIFYPRMIWTWFPFSFLTPPVIGMVYILCLYHFISLVFLFFWRPQLSTLPVPHGAHPFFSLFQGWRWPVLLSTVLTYFGRSHARVFRAKNGDMGMGQNWVPPGIGWEMLKKQKSVVSQVLHFDSYP
jgi:hypothetical protein